MIKKENIQIDLSTKISEKKGDFKSVGRNKRRGNKKTEFQFIAIREIWRIVTSALQLISDNIQLFFVKQENKNFLECFNP